MIDIVLYSTSIGKHKWSSEVITSIYGTSSDTYHKLNGFFLNLFQAGSFHLGANKFKFGIEWNFKFVQAINLFLLQLYNY